MLKGSLIFAAVALSPVLFGCSRSSTPESSVASPQATGELFQQKSIGNFGLRGTKTVALTFDDGPVRDVTPKLLKFLEDERVTATFFMVGSNIPGNEDVLKRMSAGGFILGNHTYDHLQLRGPEFLSNPEKVIAQVEKTHDLIAPYLRGNQRLYFRAPEGAWSATHAFTLNRIAKLRPYIGPIYWNIGGELQPAPVRGAPYSVSESTIQSSADWNCWEKNVSVKVCLAGYLNEIEAKHGGVILMHDKTQNTLQMVRLLVPELKRRGYEFVNMDQLKSLDQFE